MLIYFIFAPLSLPPGPKQKKDRAGVRHSENSWREVIRAN